MLRQCSDRLEVRRDLINSPDRRSIGRLPHQPELQGRLRSSATLVGWRAGGLGCVGNDAEGTRGAALEVVQDVRPGGSLTLEAVVHGVRTAIAAGAGVVVLTNGCGGLRREWTPGTPVLLAGHGRRAVVADPGIVAVTAVRF